MSSDEEVARPRYLARPQLPSGPLADLKEALYELYLAASPITLDRICQRIDELANGQEISDPTAARLSRETVRAILSDPVVPADWTKVTAVAAALIHVHPLPGKVPVVRGHPEIERIRRLWARAVAYRAPGRLITDATAFDLEVHSAERGRREDSRGENDELPAYIVRAHDEVLDNLVRAAVDDSRSGIAVLVSDSTSGKTRALFEALHRPIRSEPASLSRKPRKLRSLGQVGWRIWPSVTPLSPQRFFDELDEVQPRTVVWLNEAQRYLVDPGNPLAASIAEKLRALLVDPDVAPVLILGTLWPHYRDQIVSRPTRTPDQFAAARALLGRHTIPVPNTFAGSALEAARSSTDTVIRDALRAADEAVPGIRKATTVPLTQLVAGAPALLDLLTTTSTSVAAVLWAAMDARRLGHGEWIPLDLLHHAAPAYLTEGEQREYLSEVGWFAAAIDTLTTPLAAASARALHRPVALADQPLREVVRLDDYLDQHGRRTRGHVFPPPSFWTAALNHAGGARDLHQIGLETRARLRLKLARDLLRKAAEMGSAASWLTIGDMAKESGRVDIMISAWHEAADRGSSGAWSRLAAMRERAGLYPHAEIAAQKAVECGTSDGWQELALIREERGQVERAEHAWSRAAAAGDPIAWRMLAHLREMAGLTGEADEAARKAAAVGSGGGWSELADLRHEDGRHAEAVEAAQCALAAGDADGWVKLARRREESGQCAQAEMAAQTAASVGDVDGWVMLAFLREEAGRRNEAEVAATKTVTDEGALGWLLIAELRQEAGRDDKAEEAARRAVEAGDPDGAVLLAKILQSRGEYAEAEEILTEVTSTTGIGWTELAELHERADRFAEAEKVAQHATSSRGAPGWVRLVELREEAGKHAEAEDAARTAAMMGDGSGWAWLAEARDTAGRHADADEAARRAADVGYDGAWQKLSLRRKDKHDDVAHQVLVSGLNIDGTVATSD